MTKRLGQCGEQSEWDMGNETVFADVPQPRDATNLDVDVVKATGASVGRDIPARAPV